MKRMAICAVCAAMACFMPAVADDNDAADKAADLAEARAEAAEEAAEDAADAADERDDGRDAGQTVQDASITARIETMYLLNEHLNPFRINTTTKNGVVMLAGTVDDSIERDLAEALAKTIDGVSKVDNQLTIDPKQIAERDDDSASVRTRYEDASLTAAVRRRIAYNNTLENSNIGVEVNDQAVRLYGTVPSEAAKEEAMAVAEDTRGVLEVRDDLVVEEPKETEVAARDDDRLDDNRSGLEDIGDEISDEWTERKIEARLGWNRNVSLLDLDVEVEDGVAILSGDVLSDEQRDLAGEIASRTSGVQDVQNRIEVRGMRTSKAE